MWRDNIEMPYHQKNQSVACSFCHLPANSEEDLGDLYGPNHPTTMELLRQCTEMEEGDLYYTDSIVTSMGKSGIREIRVDLDKKICYLTAPHTLRDEEKGTTMTKGLYSENTVKELEIGLRLDSVVLHFLQTLDYIRPDQKRTNKHQKDAARVPGFNGTITVIHTDPATNEIRRSASVSCEELNQALVLIESVVFVHTLLPDWTCSTCTDGEVRATRLSSKAVWVHGRCVEHAPGVFCVGNRVHDLCTTVRMSRKHSCAACDRSGATVRAKPPSRSMYHYPCARELGLFADRGQL